ncbi:hypothetical protein L6R29_17305 [Myxococcota bacterium]|nr:hypothetical protein [Myxococcota bacterium]
MKMRILDQSIRFRLTQAEVHQFDQQGRVETHIFFGPHNTQKLSYCIAQNDQANEVFVDYLDHTVTIHVPKPIAERWIHSDEIGFSTPPNSKTDPDRVFILVEKDFECLHPRENKDDQDTFPHPRKDKKNPSC